MLLHLYGKELTLVLKEACHTSCSITVTTNIWLVPISDVSHFRDITCGRVDYAVAELLRFIGRVWNIFFILVI